jgi:hypothetical protein
MRNQAGFVAGTESLAFGCLILVAGALLLLNAWSVVEYRTQLDSAAREYLRAYTESAGPSLAIANGRQAMHAVVGDRIPSERITMEEPDPDSFGPCAPARVRISAEVPSIRMPFVGTFGTHTVEVDRVELVNQTTQMDSGQSYRPERTACAN